MTDFFHRQIREIQSSATLRFYGIFLNLTHVLTFFYWNQSSLFAGSQSPLNSDPLCYPFFPDCDLFRHLVPTTIWQVILFFYLLICLFSIWFFLNQNQTKKAYFLLILGTLTKLTLYLSNYYFTSNYHFMVHLVLLLYFFVPHKKTNIWYMVPAFYMVSGLLKINTDWLGPLTPTDLPFVSHKFPLLPPVYVILLESFMILGLLSAYRWLHWLTLLQLLIFHISSAFMVESVEPYEPLLMICLLSLFFMDDFFNSRSPEKKFRPGFFIKKILEPKANSHLKLLFNGKEKIPVYICLSIFILLQVLPSLLISESHLSGVPNLFSLNLSGSDNQCKALLVTHQQGQSVHLTGPVVKGLKPHLRCDPLVYLNQAHQLCRKNKKSREFQRLSLSLVSKRVSGNRYKKILDIPDVCQLKAPLWAELYQTLSRQPGHPKYHSGISNRAYISPSTRFKKLDSSCRATAQYRYDEKRTGVAPENSQPKSKLKIIKRIPLNVGIHNASKSSPTVDESGVYVGSDTGWFWKMNHEGKILWSFYIPGSGNGIHGSPALDDKKVYIGTYNGFLYALDKTEGDLVWANPVADYIGASPLLAGGSLYISAETPHPDGLVAKIDCNTGQTLWVSGWMGGHSHSSPAYDADNRLILAGANSGRFYAFHEDSGETVWKVQTHGQIKGTAMIHGSRVFFGSWGKNYQSLDIKTGKKNWHSYMVGRIQTSLTLVPGEELGITNTPVGEIVGINLDDGTIAWRLRHGDGNNQFSVLVTRDPKKKGRYLAWSRCKKSQLCTLDAKTGKLIHHMDIPDSFTSVPFAYKNRLYISLDNRGGLLILE